MGSQQVSPGRVNGQGVAVCERPLLSVDQEFMTKIKKTEITQKDVKNEGCSQYVIENKSVLSHHKLNRSNWMRGSGSGTWLLY
jgi:hypothetical protein